MNAKMDHPEENKDMNLNLEHGKKGESRLEVARFVIECLQLFIVFSAIMTFLFSIYPQLKPNNTNLLERANAGDSTSQIRLANFYYETGDFSESIYWYKLLLMSDSDVECKAYAYNNLGVLYSKGYGLAIEAVSEKERLKIAYSLFEKAQDISNSDEAKGIVSMNKYLLLITFGNDMFDDYDAKVASEYEFLREHRDFGELLIVPQREIISQESIESPVALSTGWLDVNTLLVLTGAKAVNTENGYAGIHYEYIKTTYAEGESMLPELEYMTPDDILSNREYNI